MAFGGFQDSQNTAPMAEINTTPLVDVMLVLLVIFIITAPLMTSAIPLDLPNAASKPVETRPETIQLAIDAKGVFYWNNTPSDVAALTTRMREAAGRQPQPEIHLRADKLTQYAAIADVLSLAQQTGLTRVGFVTQPTAMPVSTAGTARAP